MEILIYLGKVSLLLITFLLIHQLLLKRESFVQINRLFLLIGIVLSLSLPLIEFTQIEIIEVQKTETPTPMEFSYHKNPGINLNPTSVATEKSFLEKLENTDYILAIYLFGVLFFFFKMLHQSRVLGQLIRKCKKYSKNGIVYCEAKEPIEAFSFFKFMVYNPQLHQAKELEIIKAHEHVHIKEWHSVDMIVSHLLQIVLWFNPFSYWFSSAIEENLEFIADAKAVRKINSVKKYQYTLVNYLSGNANNAYASYFFKKSSLKNRIIMLNQEKSPKYNLFKFSLVLPLLFGFIWMFQTETLAKEVYVEAERKTEIDTSIPIEKSKKLESRLDTSTVSQQDSTSLTTLDKIEVKLNKYSTDESLEDLEAFFEEHDQDLKFSKIKRNKSGEITRIKIKLSDSKNGLKKELYVSGNEPIKEIVIKRDFINKTAEIAEYQEPEKDIYTLLNEAKQIYINGKIYQKDASLAITDVRIEEILDDVIKISGKELDETNMGKIYKQFEDEDTERVVYILKAVEDMSNKDKMVMRLHINKGKNPFSMNFESEYVPILDEIEQDHPSFSSQKKEINDLYKEVNQIIIDNKKFEKSGVSGKILLFKKYSTKNNELKFYEAQLKENEGGKNISDIILQVIRQEGEVKNLQVIWFKSEGEIELASIHNSVYSETKRNSTKLSEKDEKTNYTSSYFSISTDSLKIEDSYLYDGLESSPITVAGPVDLRFDNKIQPLFMIDGKIINSEAFSSIKPTEIESISILKKYELLPENLKANPLIIEEEFSGLVQIELKENTSKESFEILVTKTKEGLSMKCNTGCAWKELSFSLGSKDIRYVDASGVGSDKSKINKLTEFPNFSFEVKNDRDLIQLTKLTGTIWKELSFSIQENETYALTQNGVTKK